MWVRSSGSPREWPKLDLLSHHLRRLHLTWIVPYSEAAVEQFGDVLEEDGTFSSLLSYTKHRVRHHRIESAQVGYSGTGDLAITIQYEAGDPLLSHIPKAAEEPAWLLDLMTEFGIESRAGVRAFFEYPANAFSSVVPLPLALEPSESHARAFDAIVGIHGVKQASEGEDERFSGHDFTLDRGPAGELFLSLEYFAAAGPVHDAPERALRQALEIAELVVAKAK